jgi:hypothetical protein
MTPPSKLVGAIALFALASCDVPILGAWKSGDQTSYYNGTYDPNRLTLGNDQTGEAIIRYTLASDTMVHTDQFEVTWKQETGTTYTLSLSCVFRDGTLTDCHDQDFVMSCTLPDGGTVTTFTCKGTGVFDQYAFSWVPLTTS